jgi:hypothetical protein
MERGQDLTSLAGSGGQSAGGLANDGDGVVTEQGVCRTVNTWPYSPSSPSSPPKSPSSTSQPPRWPWSRSQTNEPWPHSLSSGIDRTQFPFTDLACRTILEAAALDLLLYRRGGYGDPGATISVLVGLVAEAQAWLIEVVAGARDHGYT